MAYDFFAYWTARTREVLDGSAMKVIQRRDVEVEALVPSRVDFILGEMTRWARADANSQGSWVRRPAILDVGCGFGRWSSALSGHYKAYHGVDVVEERVTRAQKVYGAPMVTFELVPHDRVWRTSTAFDLAFTSNVIQHLPLDAARRLLQSAALSVRPGGHLLLWENCIDIDDGMAEHMIPKKRADLHAVIPHAEWTVLHPRMHRLTFPG
jgi:SAM-dependent methyltransferase